MFITIPKVFASMNMGGFLGILFFFIVLFAALTSSIELTDRTSVIIFYVSMNTVCSLCYVRLIPGILIS